MPYISIALFVLGAALGSFLNVVALRYDSDKFLLHPEIIGGRSHCPKCGKTLRWYDLMPVVSFILLRGRCRYCGAKISWQYPIVEIISGFVLVFVSGQNIFWERFLGWQGTPGEIFFLKVFWVAVFLTLLLITIIDLRIRIIPNEAVVFLCLLGVAIGFLTASGFGIVSGSFLGPYAAIFGLRENVWLGRIFAGFAAFLFFVSLVLITRFRGMGLGDVKLAAALGLVFGWPDILLLVALAFTCGSVAGLIIIVYGRGTLKSFVPFGPFLALAAALVFFFGQDLMSWYFGLFPLG